MVQKTQLQAKMQQNQKQLVQARAELSQLTLRAPADGYVSAQRRLQCDYEGKFYRWNLKPDVSALVFSATPGHVIGPFLMEQASHLFMVEEFISAELTPERHQEILNRMFTEWLTTELNYKLSI
jgi:parvulin-like peptidyl-prolyl isomerase